MAEILGSHSNPVAASPWRWSRAQLWFLRLLGGWTALLMGLVFALNFSKPVGRAVIGMGIGTALIWIAGGGWLMWSWRDRIRSRVRAMRGPWPVKFVVGCIVLALAEEAVTTLMTNCAPLFGVKVGEAYITASADYLDVVLNHSVVVFVPMFIGWAVMLRWWRFEPFSVFLLFGMTGILAEMSFAGPQALLNFGFWIFIYGLMAWLPAYCLPAERPGRVPPFWAYPLAVVLPLFFVPLNFVLAPWLWLIPMLRGEPHPAIHFPPINAG